jgi:hypothetical protein
MNRYLVYCLYLMVGLAFNSCKEDDELFIIKEPPLPQVRFTFTDADGKPTREGGNTFLISNPGLGGSFTFNVKINPNDNRMVDSVMVEYQYSILTTGGGAASFGWAPWETVPVSTTSPAYDFTYTFRIQDLNDFYIGDEIVTTGSFFGTPLARDENETRITAFFNDGTSARSPKLTFTYAVRPSGVE